MDKEIEKGENMIPKIIHYCWFGRGTKSFLTEKCIQSWKKYCQEYQIIEWNEDNFNIANCPLYVRQAYVEKKWAFVTDYVRLKVVFDNGGIYLDTDVELKRSIDRLLGNKAFFGFEDGVHINTGLGFGAEKSSLILQELMEDYAEIPFVLADGSYDTQPCPQRNTKIFLRHGLQQIDKMQVLKDDVKIYPSIYFCPISYNTGKYRRSLKTISVHWFAASWRTEQENKEYVEHIKKKRRNDRKDFILHMPNRVLKALFGQKKYDKLKSFFKRR